MKLFSLATALVASTVGLTSAAPAIVWKNGSTSGPSHISEQINTRSLMASTVHTNSGESSSALAAVIFLVGRDADGSEGLGNLASSGKLPGVQEKYGSADSVHHHVNGVESSRTVARDARSGGFEGKVVEVSLSEFNRKLSSIAQNIAESEGGEKVSKVEQKRRRDISEADVLIVTVSPNEDASAIDSSIVSAIDSSAVRNVILSSIRSTNEVKRARKLAVVDRFTKSNGSNNRSARASSTSRRLEDEANNENNQNGENNNGQEAVEGIYYVNMTPNIFAGLLFFFMFAFTAHLGLSCMNMIEGQDVYVKKMPHIGREV